MVVLGGSCRQQSQCGMGILQVIAPVCSGKLGLLYISRNEKEGTYVRAAINNGAPKKLRGGHMRDGEYHQLLDLIL